MPTLGMSLLVMSIALVVTIASLFLMAVAPTPQRAGADELPSVTLPDATGRQVNLAAQTPLVLMFTQDCPCAPLVAATVGAAPPEVRVAQVEHEPPPAPANLAPGDLPPLRLGDPDQLLLGQLHLRTPDGDGATVVLVDRDGRVVQTVPNATSVAQYQSELTHLGR